MNGELCYEKYSCDKTIRYRIYKNQGYFDVKLERWHDEYDCMGYMEPAGFFEVRDGMVHLVGSVDEGILVGEEMMKNLMA